VCPPSALLVLMARNQADASANILLLHYNSNLVYNLPSFGRYGLKRGFFMFKILRNQWCASTIALAITQLSCGARNSPGACITGIGSSRGASVASGSGYISFAGSGRAEARCTQHTVFSRNSSKVYVITGSHCAGPIGTDAKPTLHYYAETAEYKGYFNVDLRSATLEHIKKLDGRLSNFSGSDSQAILETFRTQAKREDLLFCHQALEKPRKSDLQFSDLVCMSAEDMRIVSGEVVFPSPQEAKFFGSPAEFVGEAKESPSKRTGI
jgi:hypothetical protein